MLEWKGKMMVMQHNTMQHNTPKHNTETNYLRLLVIMSVFKEKATTLVLPKSPWQG